MVENLASNALYRKYEDMYEYYDEKEKTFYLECPKCGHKKTIKM